MHAVARVARREPYGLRDLGLGLVPWAGSVPYRSCTAPQSGRIVDRDTSVDDRSYVPDVCVRTVVPLWGNSITGDHS